MSNILSTYKKLQNMMIEVSTLESISAVLEYDEETVMPSSNSEYRAKQVALIEGIRHEKTTTKIIDDLLVELEADGNTWEVDSIERVNIREWRRDYNKQVKIPKKLTQEIKSTSIQAKSAWVFARRDNDYKSFKPWLKKMFRLQREAAECYGYEDDPYDALIDQYEIGATAKSIETMLNGLRDSLVPLIRKVGEATRQPNPGLLYGNFPIEKQKELCQRIATKIGYDFSRGAMGIAIHPFCETLGKDDIRIMTRYKEERFDTALLGIMHETGHATYDQNMLQEHWGTPISQNVSLGIHESQSRFWENFIGLSKSFWRTIYPDIQSTFPALKGIDLDDFYFSLNQSKPSLIRVDADELTYNLHILIRFELEKMIFSGDLSFDDIPEAWNSKVKQYLGLDVPNDTQGCLQDIHWPIGIIGYFPTYALGNIYSCQLAHKLTQELGDLDELISNGEFIKIREWFTKNIHSQGRRFSPSELIKRATGEEPNSKYLIKYLSEKYGKLYGISL
jgi:carboxypeptidase Taq